MAGQWLETSGVSIANGSRTLTAASALWLVTANPGNGASLDGGIKFYEIESIDANDQITFRKPFAETSVVGGTVLIDNRGNGYTPAEFTLIDKFNKTLAAQTDVFTISGTPSNTLGADGSIAFDPNARAYYQKISGAWSAAVSLGGADGIDSGFKVSIDRLSTAMADPGNTKMRFNSATFAAITAIAIDDLAADFGNPDVSGWFNTWGASTNAVKGTLILQKVGSVSNYMIFSITAVTDNAGWSQLGVSPVASGGALANNEICTASFIRAGNKGTDGNDGINGINTGIRWQYSSTITMTDPGTGLLRFNNASFASVTSIAISDLCSLASNPDCSAWSLSWDDSSNLAHRGTLTIKKSGAEQNFVQYAITGPSIDQGTWVQLAVTYVASGGSFTNLDQLYCDFDRTGNAGTNGSAGTTLQATSTSTRTPTIGPTQNWAMVAAADFAFGQRVRVVDNGNVTNYAMGLVTSNTGGVLTITVDETGLVPASSSSWTISLAGNTGATGPAGGLGALSAAKGGIPVGDGTTFGVVPVGVDGTTPNADSTKPYGWDWAARDAINAGPYWTSVDVPATVGVTDISAAINPYVRITGSGVNITSFGTGIGRLRFVEFTGTVNLIYNGTSMILPGLANIMTQAGDKGTFVSDGLGNWKCLSWTPISFLPREKLSSNRTYFVRFADGSDSNTGRSNTAGGGFLTIQKALDVVYGTLDLGGFDVTIQVSATAGGGLITSGGSVTSPQVGKGTVTLLGDATTPSNYTISTSGGCIVVSGAGSVLNVRGFKLTSSGGNLLQATFGGRINYGKIEFGATTSQYHMRADNAGGIGLISGDNYSISGSAQGHMILLSYGLVSLPSQTVTITGTPAWGAAFINCQGGQCSLYSMTWSGAATGQRYLNSVNGVINTFGAGTASTYFPGNSNGSNSTGAQQV